MIFQSILIHVILESWRRWGVSVETAGYKMHGKTQDLSIGVLESPRPMLEPKTLPGEYADDDPFLEWLRRSRPLQKMVGTKTVFVVRANVWKYGWEGVLERTELFDDFRVHLKRKRACVLIDGSQEGVMPGQEMLETFQSQARAWGIDVSEILYTSSNRTLTNECWLGTGEKHPTPTWIPFDWWLHESIDAYRDIQPDPPSDNGQLIDRLFLCANRKARPSRLAVLAHLNSPEMDGSSYWSLQAEAASLLVVDGTLSTDVHAAFAATEAKLPCVSGLLDKAFGEVVAAGQSLPSEARKEMCFADFHFFPPQPEVGKTLIDIVNETDFTDGTRSRRITEKTLRSLLLGRPFIHVGSPGVIEMLHSYGFQTGFGVIDESYDAVRDPNERMSVLLGEMQRLAGLYREIGHAAFGRSIDKGALEHNRNLCFNSLQTQLCEEADLRIESILQGRRLSSSLLATSVAP